MPRHGVARAAHQQREAVVEPRLDLARRQRPRPRRGELERQRRPVEPRAHRDDRRVGLLVERQVRAAAAPPARGTAPARPPAAAATAATPSRRSARAARGWWRRSPPPGTPAGSRRPRRPRRARARSCRGTAAAAAPRAASAATPPRRAPGRRARRVASATALPTWLRVRERARARPTTPRRASAPACSAASWPSSRVLPAPARAGDRQQPRAGHAGVQVGELRLAPDERRRPAREVVRRRVERARRRPVLEREHPQRRREVPQPVQRRGRAAPGRSAAAAAETSVCPGLAISRSRSARDTPGPANPSHASPVWIASRASGSLRRAATAAASASATAGKAVTPASLARNVAKVTRLILTDIGHLAARSWPGGRCSCAARRGIVLSEPPTPDRRSSP